MRILHVETGKHLYGGALQVAYLIRGLQRLGVENMLLSDARSPLSAEVVVAGARVDGAAWSGEVDARMYGRLRQVIRDWQPDLVHVHSRRGADLWGPLAARSAGVPHIITRRVDNPEPRWLVKLRYGKAAAVVGISERITQVLREEGVPPPKLRTIRSGVDVYQYRPQREPARECLQRLFRLPADGLYVGMIAQFIRRKGHHRLLAIARDLIREFPNVYFILFGQGPEFETVQSEIERLELQRHIILPGFRGDLPALVPGLDLVVHPADLEGLGVSLLQASACAVPVVAGKAGGIPEIIHDDVNGYLLDPDDLPIWHRTLQRLLADAELRQRLGQQGRDLAVSEFSIETTVERNHALYREVLGG
ncbi:MAG: glycosyltransferase [Verrucomicrobiota bacterium JB022]|nr:glycosyltransferase [Verrucomicrobiota bacterium JB022]